MTGLACRLYRHRNWQPSAYALLDLPHHVGNIGPVTEFFTAFAADLDDPVTADG